MRTLLLPLGLLLCVGACKKDDTDPNGLPKATQEGKNTGDFFLNGAAFSPRPRISSPGSTPVGATVFPGRAPRTRDVQLSFYRMIDRNSEQGLNIILYGIAAGPGGYALNQVANPFVVPGSAQRYAVCTHYFPSPKRQYITGPTAQGSVHVTRFDTVAHIISGTFEAKLKEFNGQDSLQVTQGRFDLKF